MVHVRGPGGSKSLVSSSADTIKDRWEQVNIERSWMPSGRRIKEARSAIPTTLNQLSYKFTRSLPKNWSKFFNFQSLYLVQRTRRVSLLGVFVKANHTGTETNPLPFIEDDDRRVLFCMVTQLHPIPVSSTDKGKLFFIFSTYTKTWRSKFSFLTNLKKIQIKY